MKISAVFPKKESSAFRINAKKLNRQTGNMKQKLSLSDKLLLISAAVIMLGITAGVLLFRTNSSYMTGELCKYFIAFSTDFSGKSYMEILSGFLSVNLLYYCIATVMGTSALGEIPVALITFLQAMGIGALTSYLFTGYGIRGFEYFLLVLFPGKVILLIAGLLLSQNCMKSVIQIRSSLKQASHEKYDLKIYIMRSLFILIIVVVSCLVDSITVKLFAPLFNLN